MSNRPNLFFNKNQSEDEFDLPKSIEKMKDHAQFLRGKSIMLQGKEEKFIAQQKKIIQYRNIIMQAIREFAITHGKDREDSISIINKFDRILDEIDIEIEEDNETGGIMG